MAMNESELQRLLQAKQRELKLLRRRLQKAALSFPAPKTKEMDSRPTERQEASPEQGLPPIESLTWDDASSCWRLQPES